MVTDSQVKAQIAGVCTEYSRRVWKGFAPETIRFLGGGGGTWNKSYMKTVPVLVAVCYRVTDEPTSEVALISTWMAIQNILLAATCEGLGPAFTHTLV